MLLQIRLACPSRLISQLTIRSAAMLRTGPFLVKTDSFLNWRCFRRNLSSLYLTEYIALVVLAAAAVRN